MADIRNTAASAWNYKRPAQRSYYLTKLKEAGQGSFGLSNGEKRFDKLSAKIQNVLIKNVIGPDLVFPTSADIVAEPVTPSVPKPITLKSREAVSEAVRYLIDDKFALDNVNDSDTFVGLGLDSLDSVEFTMETEKLFNIMINDELAASLKTVGQVIDHVTSLVVPTSEVEPIIEDVPKETYEALDLLISFDDTGSMYSVRQQVRSKIIALLGSLYEDIPKLRVGIIIHNDYCDRPNHIYVQDFTNDRVSIERFVNQRSPGGGGDAPECYELALHEGTKLKWSEFSRKAFIIIGDEVPHHVGYRYGSHTNEIDWRNETRKLNDMGVTTYGVQALGRRHATQFYIDVSRLTGGIKLDLSQFQHITDYIKAVAYHQAGQLDEFEQSDPSFKTNIALKNMFDKLRGGSGTASSEKLETLSKFQVMSVPVQAKIKTFVEDNGCTFRKGKGYYQLIERTEDGKANFEIIQANKEVLFVNKETGEVNADTMWCRNQLGIPYGTKGSCRPLQIPHVMSKYDVYIQSNSYTRNLDKGTKFLYELDAR